MKKLLLTCAFALLGICAASANNYVADDAAIDALVANSTEMVMEADMAAPAAATYVAAGKNPIVATVLSWCLGWCGVHRYYLGTEPWMVLPYLLTGGGFGVVYAVDSVLLLVDALENRINGQYINNPRIIMWADLF